MSNLYSITKGQTAIVSLTRAMRDTIGNLPPVPAVFPDSMAAIVRNAPDGVRELAMARWGMPGAPEFGGTHVTNIRNIKNPHWQEWLMPENRCVVPWTSFCEYADTKPKKTPTWFAFDETRPLAVFAGIWTSWHGTRGTKANPVEGEHQLFGFLTTEANDVVGAIHSKAMPVILTAPAEIETWMTAPAEEALKLQRALSNQTLKIVATGERKDESPSLVEVDATPTDLASHL
jgi:putative SOS response-associated peptidase YedK